ncbi:transferase [Cylindrospermum sp. FACHB-282]|uniref:transferase n=1 Tax=Cylindrospermum sp. FACHB-282 TaxID=2692794 RepID=UPI0016892DED|nr:transferase [Cylindrospermum sp. FACHB-282]MBD2385546.1 transferase [Cylindrospermum sp. FACHB-282]
MSVPPLRLSNNFDSYISGEVTIHESAVLAPGVILQAAVNSKIIIGPGVCIGMGTILQVHEGILEVEAGANLGAGFLMVGKGKIGTNACIGSATTVFHCSVEPGQVVPPGSILGDTSRQISETEQPEASATSPTSTSTEKPEENAQVISSNNLSASAFMELKYQSTFMSKSSPTPGSQSPPKGEDTKVADSTLEEDAQKAATEVETQESEPKQPDAESPNIFGAQIYGQSSIQRLLSTLLPHRQSLSNPNNNQFE